MDYYLTPRMQLRPRSPITQDANEGPEERLIKLLVCIMMHLCLLATNCRGVCPHAWAGYEPSCAMSQRLSFSRVVIAVSDLKGSLLLALSHWCSQGPSLYSSMVQHVDLERAS